MARFEFYSDAGDLDQTRAATLLRSFGAKRVAVGVMRDMGTWWGSNQPPVVAFSLADGIKWDSLLDGLCDQYRKASGKRVSWETRRTRQRKPTAPPCDNCGNENMRGDHCAACGYNHGS